MPGLTTTAELVLGGSLLVAHLACVGMTHALRSFSRSRLELLCSRRGRADRADAIVRDDIATERAAELLGILSAFGLAALLAVMAALNESSQAIVVCLALGLMAHLMAAVAGRAFAESVADLLWPVFQVIRQLASPFTFVLRQLEALLERRARNGQGAVARPPSVEVEIHSRTGDELQEAEPEIPDETMHMLERVAALRDRDVASLMTPRTNILVLPESASLDQAAQAFIDSGLSRIPLYGEHRDDIVGVLYVKDMIPSLLHRNRTQSFHARALARAPLSVPETKPASDLLDELRKQRVQMAIVFDEFGSVSGLITLEDLLEAIVGPIDDEHDAPSADDEVLKLAADQFEVDAALPLEELNERLGLDLPTDRDFQTLGGLVFDVLGRIPEVGDQLQVSGAEITVLEVVDHAIRRLRLDLKPSRQPAGRS